MYPNIDSERNKMFLCGSPHIVLVRSSCSLCSSKLSSILFRRDISACHSLGVDSTGIHRLTALAG